MLVENIEGNMRHHFSLTSLIEDPQIKEPHIEALH